MEIFLSLLLVLAVIGAIYSAVAASNRRQALSEEFAPRPDFTITRKLVGCDGVSGLAIDLDRNQVLLSRVPTPDEVLKAMSELSVEEMTREYSEEFNKLYSRMPTAEIGPLIEERRRKRMEGAHTRVISYRDLLSCEVSEDSQVVSRTSRSSQIGGAVVGGLALGGLGAVVGALTGTTVSSDTVSRIQLIVVIDDPKAPVHVVTLLNSPCTRDSALYADAIVKGREWSALIDILIRRADSEVTLSTIPSRELVVPESMRAAPSSVADELSKLVVLRDSGVLTDEEFNTQKRKILS